MGFMSQTYALIEKESGRSMQRQGMEQYTHVCRMKRDFMSVEGYPKMDSSNQRVVNR